VLQNVRASCLPCGGKSETHNRVIFSSDPPRLPSCEDQQNGEMDVDSHVDAVALKARRSPARATSERRIVRKARLLPWDVHPGLGDRF
jgi:hypothetical protein